ncbi:MAG TPA: hypothetical protein VIR60_10420 [Gammaproteobacteria bacterium]
MHKRWLYGVIAGLWLSGALWLLVHYLFAMPGEFGIQPHPSEKWWLRLHGLFSFASLVVLGSVLPIHARRAWQLNKNRATGIGMKMIFGWLALTGYALYYFADDTATPWLPWSHWSPGIALPLALWIHIRRGRLRKPVTPSVATAVREELRSCSQQ